MTDKLLLSCGHAIGQMYASSQHCNNNRVVLLLLRKLHADTTWLYFELNLGF